MKYLAGIFVKKISIKMADNIFVFKRKVINNFLQNLNHIKIGEILFKNSEKRWMKSTEFTLFCRKFKSRYLPVKNENQENLFHPIFYAAQAF